MTTAELDYFMNWRRMNAEKLRSSRKEWQRRNPDQKKQGDRVYRARHVDEISRKRRAHRLKLKREEPDRFAERELRYYLKRHGFTLETFVSKYRTQKGRCAICGRRPAAPRKHGRALVPDHDHSTGQARDLLCRSCNALIGLAHESPEVLRSAIRYLRKWRTARLNLVTPCEVGGNP